MYKLIIDYRERKIIQLLFGEKIPQLNTNIQKKWNEITIDVEIQNLPVGDFIIQENIISNETSLQETTQQIQENKSEIIKLIIERKTISDLESSIMDGRFRQQKSRLFESVNDNNKILYIIEKSKCKKINIIHGSLLNMLYKHHFKVLQTDNLNETLTILSILYKKFSSGEYIDTQLLNINENNNDNNDKNIKPVKLISKGDDINKKLFQYMLCVIPGISIKISNKIVEIYPTIKDLMDKYDSLIEDSDKEKLLANIIIGSKKLGPSLSKKIWNTLYFNSCN